MIKIVNSFFLVLLFFAVINFNGCDYMTHRTLTKETVTTDEEPDPDFNVSLDYNYQDFITFMFLGNRSESFSTYFNKFYTANEDFDEALKEYKVSTIAGYNKRLDSINILTPILQSTKDKFTKVIERCSKIIQYNKNTKYFDKAVLLIGLSYFYSNDFLQAERKFNEFLSKLSKSDIANDAILYLGITKFRLRKNADGETILKSLLQNSKRNDIKAEALQQLAIYNIGLKNITNAQDFLNQSIELTKDNELKAERQFLLAKVYTLYNKVKAPQMYAEAYKNTSDFDFEFYAKLNEAKAFNDISKYREAAEILKKMDSKYIDYPDFKQLVELEIANTDFFEKRYSEAKEKYFLIIVKYPSSKAAAEAYYQLGLYYETVLKNYLKALVSYRKANETSSSLDYADLSNKKANVLDRYFTLQGIINDTAKIEIPNEEKELEIYKKKYDEEMNRNQKKITDPNKGGLENPKGGGVFLRDTIPGDDSLLKEFNEILEKKKEEKVKLDTLPLMKNDSVVVNKDSSQTTHHQNDSTVVPVVNTDSVKAVKENLKLNAYFELAEIFYYNLNHPDSSVFYLNKIINGSDNADLVSKAAFYLGTIYKSGGDTVKANEYFNEVIKKFPNTIYANESRKYLGLETVIQSFDAADSLITVADKLLKSNNTIQIPEVLHEALEKYPQSPLIPKVYYTLGWYFENVKQDKDSMMKYFDIVLKKYPNTSFASSVKPTFDYYASLNNKDTSGVMDSLKLSDSTLNKTKDTTLTGNKDSLNVKTDNGDGGELKTEEKKNNNTKIPDKKESGEDSFIIKDY